MSESDQSSKGPKQGEDRPAVSSPSTYDKAEGARAAAQVDRKSGSKEHDYKLAATKGESDEATLANLHLGLATGLAMGALVEGGAALAEEDKSTGGTSVEQGDQAQIDNGVNSSVASSGIPGGADSNSAGPIGSSTLARNSSATGGEPETEPSIGGGSGDSPLTPSLPTPDFHQNADGSSGVDTSTPKPTPTTSSIPGDTNSAPTDIVVQAMNVSELAPAGTVAAILDAIDTDSGDQHTYEFVDGAGNVVTHPSFEIVGDEIRVRDGAVLDFEDTASYTILVRVTDSSGGTYTEPVTIDLTDANEHSISAISDTNADANGISEGAIAGDAVGITVSATDGDVGDQVSYSVDDSRFEVDADGLVTVADGASFDAETESSISLTVTATSTDGTTSNETFTVAVSDENEVAVSPVTDTDGAINTVFESATPGDAIGITASASDSDISDSVSYAVDDARFEVDAGGVVTVANGASFDAETENTISLTVTATSTDGSTSSETFTVSVGDENEFSITSVIDTDGTANAITEADTAGTTVGITVSASDADVSDSVSYSVDDSRFQVDADGVVRVASGASFDADTEHSIDITVTATSTDGSTSDEVFTVIVNDLNEVAVSSVTDIDHSTNTVSEAGTAGATIGLQAFATDGDSSDSVSYAVDDARFEIDANGVVTVANGAIFDAETEGSINLTVTATSTDGSTSNQSFAVSVSDENEVSVSAILDIDGSANTISETASVGESVGIQASATDGDVTDTVSYTVDDARFEVDADGVVTVANGASFDAETEGSISLTVTATSTDGSASNETFTISVSDENEVSISAVTDIDAATNVVSESASAGAATGIQALATDGDVTDSVSYSVDDARFEVDANGVVTVANGASFDAETEGSISLTVTATSTDGSASNETFTVSVSDENEVSISAVTDVDASANTISEIAVAGATVGIQASATDGDVTDTVSYSVDDARFEVDADGVVTVANGASFDAETEGSISLTVTATSTDGSTSNESFKVSVGDENEVSISAVTDIDATTNAISEAASTGAATGIQASATDSDVTDSVSYSVDDARFEIDANGVVTVANGASFDAETEGSISLTVTATSTDGSTSNETFAVSVSDENEVSISAVTDIDASADTISEAVAAGATIGIQASATDGDATDTVSYSVDDARFEIDANGVITIANGASFDAETEGSISLTVTATSTDGSTSNETFTVSVSDENEVAISAVTDVDASANSISETAAAGATVGIQASATDGDVTDTVSYAVDDARFEVDANGVVTVANGASFDAETEGSISLTITATSTDGSTSNETFTISVDDENEVSVSAVTDVDATANAISETAAVGATVGIQASATDGDVTDTVSYSVDDARFEVDADGIVTVANGASFDAETEGSISLTVTATSTDGSTSSETFSVSVGDENEVSVSAVTDVDAAANTISEMAVTGTVVGIQASATDGDVSDTVSYAVNDARFEIDADGVVTVADGASFDALTESSIDLTVTATSTDGSSSSETFAINVSNVNETPISITFEADHMRENTAHEDILITVADPDGDSTFTFSVDDSRFEVFDDNGEYTLRLKDGVTLNHESEATVDVAVTATDSGGLSVSQSLTIDVRDLNDNPIAVHLSNSSVAENDGGATIGTLTATDEDSADTHSYTVSDSRFEVVNGDLKLKDGVSLDHEAEPTVSVTITATDSGGLSANQTVSIAVTDVNEGPNAGAVVLEATYEDLSIIITEAQLLAASTDPDNDSLSVTDLSVDAAHGTLVDNGAGSWTFTPVADFAGDYLPLSFTVSDGTFTDTATATIDVIAVADTPVISIGSNAQQVILGHGNASESGFEGGNLDTSETSSAFIGSIGEWTTTSDAIEVKQETLADGTENQFLELNDDLIDVYQDAENINRDFDTEAGRDYSISFEYAPRPGQPDYVNVMEVLVDGVVVETITADGTFDTTPNWQTHTITFEGTGSPANIEFRTAGTAQQYGRGMYLDDVTIIEHLPDQTASGNENTVIILPEISVSHSDQDGSETLSVLISDIPDGAVLSDGSNSFTADAINTEADISNWQMDSLTVQPPADFDGNFDLKVTATTTDDGDTSVSTDVLHVNVLNVDETLVGTSGVDILDGGAGNDTISGLAGDDDLSGGTGNDTLIGGLGDDVLSGGDGVDIFQYALGDGNDTVTGGGGSWIDTIQLGDAAGGASVGDYGSDWTLTVNTGTVDSVDMANQTLTLSDDASGYIETSDGGRIDFSEIDQVQW